MAELTACPECKKHLQVPEELNGKKVQCPECKHTFTAVTTDAVDLNLKTSTTVSRSAPPKTPAWEKSSGSRASREKKRRDEDDDEDYDDDDHPRRGRRRSALSRGNLAPHRGGMILAFGIISIMGGPVLCLPFIFGPIAWFMGNGDLREIREGRMDPEGEGLTQVGRILGIAASILAIVGIGGVCAYFVVFFAIVGLFVGAAGNKNVAPPRRF